MTFWIPTRRGGHMTVRNPTTFEFVAVALVALGAIAGCCLYLLRPEPDPAPLCPPEVSEADLAAVADVLDELMRFQE